MERFLLISHVACGALVLVLGIFQMLTPKGGKHHIRYGKIYVAAMWWICLSALWIIVFYRFSLFLMVIAALTFYASFSGIRVLKRKNLTEKWYDWAAAALTGCFGLSLIGYGIVQFINYQGNEAFLLICTFFGFITFLNAFRDLRFFIKKLPKTPLWWLRQHISAMGGSYIAAVTAFAVQNPDLLLPNSSYQWLLWLLPSVIGSPLIGFAIRKHTNGSRPT